MSRLTPREALAENERDWRAEVSGVVALIEGSAGRREARLGVWVRKAERGVERERRGEVICEEVLVRLVLWRLKRREGRGLELLWSDVMWWKHTGRGWTWRRSSEQRARPCSGYRACWRDCKGVVVEDGRMSGQRGEGKEEDEDEVELK